MGADMHAPRGSEAEPTADQLLAMAYADGELDAAARHSFESRLAGDTALAREVAKHRAFAVLARRSAAPEPADYEWRRLAADPLQRGTLGVGWVALSVGVLGLLGLYLWRFLVDDSVEWVERALVLSATVGGLALLAAAVRARLRTLPLDPYRNVER